MNIAEILKDAPRGTKLYSPIFGDVLLNKVSKFNIEVLDTANNIQHFIYTGLYNINGECMLFPSRENRDWNNVCLFKDGDILISSSGNPFIFKEVKDNVCSSYCGIDRDSNFWECSNYWTPIRGVRKATEKEIDLFFEKLRKEGFKWNSSTLTLEKLENKFDINTLKPFDKVLVRDDDKDEWYCEFYSHYRNISYCKYGCISSSFHQCIPYNYETKHLVGTDKDCPEYYKTW